MQPKIKLLNRPSIASLIDNLSLTSLILTAPIHRLQDPLVRKWWTVTFLQSDEETNTSASSMAWRWAYFHFWVNYCFKKHPMTLIAFSFSGSPERPQESDTQRAQWRWDACRPRPELATSFTSACGQFWEPLNITVCACDAALARTRDPSYAAQVIRHLHCSSFFRSAAFSESCTS